MTLNAKRIVIALLSVAFVLSLVFVQYHEVTRRRREAGLADAHVVVPESSKSCVECHTQSTAGIVDHWNGSTHAEKGVGCFECHQAAVGEADAFQHYGMTIATVVTPLDCSRCHPQVAEEFGRSHHAAAGNILASLDNRLAEVAEGARVNFNPHSPTPGRPEIMQVMGGASAFLGCKQCHGSLVALQSIDGSLLTSKDFKPDPLTGKPTNLDAYAKIKKNADGKPLYAESTWPNTGIGRMNLDGSLGSCSACHSRHDFSPRRARQPESCGKCHMGPDHPQKEIFEESKHGVAFRDMKDSMNLDAKKWVLGEDYSAAPTCATCHMSANTRNGRRITHDPGERISWTNRPPISQVMDTDINHKVVTETDPELRRAQTVDTWQQKRDRMKEACSNCHTPDYINGFYTQYDNLVVLFNEKFAKPGTAIMKVLRDQKLLTQPEFDEAVEWTWYLLWHHEGRRARHGASMMGPDYTHWHGMFEVAERWYQHFIPEVRTICAEAEKAGKSAEADAVRKVVDEIMARPEHQWEAEAAASGGGK